MNCKGFTCLSIFHWKEERSKFNIWDLIHRDTLTFRLSYFLLPCTVPADLCITGFLFIAIDRKSVV